MAALDRFVLLAGLLVPSSAVATGHLHPRTPVVWEPPPACMTIVDRSQSPLLQFTYTIPYEDPRPEDATDEVEDSREHQFLAFCRGHSVQEPLPTWLSQADVAAAAAEGLIDEPLAADEVIDTSAAWKGCLVRITADAARRGITFAAAADPVVWDTAGVPVGAYVIDGYTWEPPYSLYSPRPGVIKVVDHPDLAASPPALAIANTSADSIVYSTEQLQVFGCISAMAGATLTGAWASTDESPGALVWQPFAEHAPVEGDTFSLTFAPPAAAAGQSVAIRVDAVDPLGRTYTAHMNSLVYVLAGGPAEGGDESGPAGTTGDSDTGAPGSTTSPVGDDGPTDDEPNPSTTDTDAGPMQSALEDRGCAGCGVDPAATSLVWWLPVVFARRRRARTTST